MSLIIADCKLDRVTIEETADGTKVGAQYSLITGKGRVVASKAVSSKTEYQTEPFVPSGLVLKLFQQAVDAYSKELRDTLGFTE